MIQVTPELLGVAFVITVVYYLVQLIVSGLRNPLSHIPGPWHTRFTSLAIHWARIRGRNLEYTRALNERYGPVARASPSTVTVGSAAGYHTIYQVRSGFRKTPRMANLKIHGRDSTFTFRDPREHAPRRRLIGRGLTLSNIRSVWEPRVRPIVEAAVAQIQREAQTGDADLYKWWRFMAGDVIGEMAFGEQFGFVASGQDTSFFKALQNQNTILIMRVFVPWLVALLQMIPIAAVQEFAMAQNIVYDKGGVAVKNMRAMDKTHGTLFNDIVAMAEDGEKPLDDLDVIAEASLMTTAGTDTTAILLTYAVWEVLRNPDLQRRLEAEVAGLKPGFKGADVEALPLLGRVVDETHRLHNPAGAHATRIVPAGGTTIEGVAIPEGQMIVTSTWALGQNEACFPDAKRFDESRWENPSPEQKAHFNPFAQGPRSCIGVHLAQLETRLALALFFRQCAGARIADSMTDDMMEHEVRFITVPKAGVCNITLRPPSDAGFPTSV